MSTITSALQSVLQWIYGFIGDYGWSVVLFTIAFRFCLMPLDIISRRSMKKQSVDMARIQPKLDALKVKYANDQDKLNKKTAELYKKEGVSMFGGCAGGCLPMLIQWPIFIAFYSAIRTVSNKEIFELFNAMQTNGSVEVPRWFWVQNLWQPDTFQSPVFPAFSSLVKNDYFNDAGVTEQIYNSVMKPLLEQYDGVVNGLYILPVLAAGASLLQGWISTNLTKTPEMRAKEKADKEKGIKDPSQSTSKIMQYMFPIMSFFFCMTSSAAFALYWLASNVASIGTTLLIDKVFLRNLTKKLEEAQSQPKEDIL